MLLKSRIQFLGALILVCSSSGGAHAEKVVTKKKPAACEDVLVAAPADTQSAINERAVAVAEFYLRFKRLPLGSELVKDKEAQRPDEAQIEAWLLEAVRLRPELFRAFRSNARTEIGNFFSARLRLPDAEEKAGLLNLRESADRSERFLNELFRNDPVDVYLGRVTERLADAYLSAMAQAKVPEHLRKEPKPPTLEELYRSLVQTKTNQKLLQDTLDGKFSVAVLGELIERLGGMGEVEAFARSSNPGRFSNFRSSELYSTARQERLLAALETKGGFVITSINAGMEDNQAQLATMLKYCEDRDFDLIITPTNRYMEGISATLLKHPRVHILTNTIENAYLKISSIGILPKNQNPFASLNKPNQFNPGQIFIVGSPQANHRVIPTATNHMGEATLWSTGSLSVNVYPYRYRVQARTSEIASENHENAFLVVEKSDAKAGLYGKGLPNHWHQPRKVEFIQHEDDPHPAFTDLGRYYYFEKGEAKVGRQNFDTAVGGDLHESKSDTSLIGSYQQIFSLAPPKSFDFVIHDAINSTGACRHDYNNVPRLIENFKVGDLCLKTEIGGLVQFDNALAEHVRFRHYVDSNHTYWLDSLIEKRPQANTVINGDIVREFEHAQAALTTKKPLEYILNGRKGYVAKLEPSQRQIFEQRDIMVEHPESARVIPLGDPFYVGPAHRQVALHNHGHKGTNGARPSPASHAVGNVRSVIGDSHSTFIQGGHVNVGTNTPKRVGYNDDGYSSWSQGAALVYPDGTIQLLMFNSATATWFQRTENGFLPPKQFFADEPLKVIPNDNDLVPDRAIEDQFSSFMERRRRWQRLAD